jgi:hypothetical protein
MDFGLLAQSYLAHRDSLFASNDIPSLLGWTSTENDEFGAMARARH